MIVMASKGQRSKVDHDYKVKRPKVSSSFSSFMFFCLSAFFLSVSCIGFAVE